MNSQPPVLYPSGSVVLLGNIKSVQDVSGESFHIQPLQVAWGARGEVQDPTVKADVEGMSGKGRSNPYHTGITSHWE